MLEFINGALGDEWGWFVTAVAAFLLLALRLIKNSSEVRESPRAQKLYEKVVLYGGIFMVMGTLSATWTHVVLTNKENLEDWLLVVPAAVFGFVIISLSIFYVVAVTDPGRTQTNAVQPSANAAPNECEICGHPGQ